MPTATDVLRQYHEGKIDFAELRAKIAVWPWKRYTFNSPDRYGVETGDPDVQSGTWEDVDAARDMGWLTNAEVNELSAAVAEAQPAP